MENIYKQQLISKAEKLYSQEYQGASKVVFSDSSIQKTIKK